MKSLASACISWLLLVVTGAAQQEAEPAPAVSYFSDVRPILQASCQGCHQPAKAEGDIVLMNHADLLRVFDVEPLVVPGDPGRSLLVDVITPVGSLAPEMPPEEREPLAAGQVDLIRRWIAAGAHDDTPAALRARTFTTEPPTYTRAPVVTSLDFAPDGELLAVSGRSEVLLHRSDGSQLIGRLVGMSERVDAVAFSPDGTRLAVAGGSPARLGELQIWDVASQTLELSLPVTFDTIHGVSWSPDNKLVAFGGNDNTVRAVQVETGKQVLYQGAHADWVLGTAFSSDASHVVSVGRDRSMKLIKVDSQQFIDNITSITPGALKGGLMSVARHPARDELLVGGADGAPKIYRMFREKKRVIGDDFNLMQAFTPLPGRVFSVAWSTSGEHIVAGGSSRGAGEVRVYPYSPAEEGKEGDPQPPVWTRAVSAGIYAVDFHPREPRVAAAGFDGLVRIFDATDGATLHEFVPVPITADSQGEWQ